MIHKTNQMFFKANLFSILIALKNREIVNNRKILWKYGYSMVILHTPRSPGKCI